MKRVTSVLLAVLLGALATGAGMGVFLKLANDDRARLAAGAAQAKATAEHAELEKQQLADEANKKVEEANREVARAERILQALREERELLAQAKPLARPAARELRGWRPAVSLTQGVSLSLPPGTAVEANDERSFTAVKLAAASSTSSLSQDSRWLSILPFDASLENELNDSLATSSRLLYSVAGRLLVGRQGRLSRSIEDKETGSRFAGANGYEKVTILRVEQAATTTHLMWIKDPGTLGSSNGFEKLLGTLEFKS